MLTLINFIKTEIRNIQRLEILSKMIQLIQMSTKMNNHQKEQCIPLLKILLCKDES